MECQHSLRSEQNENDKFNLFKILPFLRNDKTTYTKLLTKLEEMQIDEGDLKFVEVEDLVPTLHHIKAKRLVAGWRKNMKIGDGKVTFSAADSTMCEVLSANDITAEKNCKTVPRMAGYPFLLGKTRKARF